MSAQVQTAAVIIIGDEILSGKIVEKNAQYLIREIRALGMVLRHLAFLPDDIEVIGREVRRHSEENDFVFTTGGVGPTHDDVTVAGIAHGFGVEVVSDPILEKLVRTFYKQNFCDAHLLLARVPKGSVLEKTNESDAAFVTRFENVFIFPGVPSLLQAKFPIIREQFRSSPFWGAKIFCTAEEGTMAETLADIAKKSPTVSIGSYPRLDATDHRVMLTIEGKKRKPLFSRFLTIYWLHLQAPL